MVKAATLLNPLNLMVSTLSIDWFLAGCATSTPEPLDERVAAMSDLQLISYYHGINDRLKDIQARTRETDRQGTILEKDHLARMPYVMGGEAWKLERQQERAHQELIRRNLTP